MIIALDVDEPCAALRMEILRRYNRDYDDQLQYHDLRHFDMHHDVKPECGLAIYDYFRDKDLYDDVPVVLGALHGVERLRTAGHEIIFVTTNTFDMTDQKARWLVRHGFLRLNGHHALPEQLIVTGVKHRVDADLLIDDRVETVIAWTAKQRPAVLWNTPANQEAPHRLFEHFLQIGDEVEPQCSRVDNWDQLLEAVSRYS